MCTHLYKKIFSIAAVAATLPALAQEKIAAAADSPSSGNNTLVILLSIIAMVLAFVIWGLARVLIEISRETVRKTKKPAVTAAVMLTALLFISQSSIAQATEPVKEANNYGGLSATTFYVFASIISIEVLVILFLFFSIRGLYASWKPDKVPVPVKESAFRKWWSSLDKKIFTKAIPVEREADFLLDHNYDGIRELDNALPPWWKYGFYITILVAVIYMLNYHVFDTGKNPEEEYTAEMQHAALEKEIYEANNKDKIDENNVPMAKDDGITKAREIFESKCWPCHGKLGEGGAGPNLTDDYWLHKGTLNDIYHTIKNGYPDKGMQSWSKEYTPKEISYLASYVKKLHGTNPPNSKPPQGELFSESGAPALDSLATPGKPSL